MNIVNFNSIYEEVFIIGMGTFPVAVYDIFAKCGVSSRLIEYGESSSYLKYLCDKKSINYENLSSNQLTKLLRNITKPTLIVSAVNKYIFPNEILSKPNIVAINYHNSILPNHRGSHAEAFSIFDMDRYTGVTWHYVAKEIDQGNVIAMKKLRIDRDDTSISLLSKQNKEALKLFKSFLSDLLTNKIVNVKKVYPGGELHLSKDLPSNGVFNFEWSIDKMYAFLRSFDYGELNIIGRPHLVYEGVTYAWKTYLLIPEGCRSSRITLDTDKRTIEIHKAGSINYIRLVDIEII